MLQQDRLVDLLGLLWSIHSLVQSGLIVADSDAEVVVIVIGSSAQRSTGQRCPPMNLCHCAHSRRAHEGGWEETARRPSLLLQLIFTDTLVGPIQVGLHAYKMMVNSLLGLIETILLVNDGKVYNLLHLDCCIRKYYETWQI